MPGGIARSGTGHEDILNYGRVKKTRLIDRKEKGVQLRFIFLLWHSSTVVASGMEEEIGELAWQVEHWEEEAAENIVRHISISTILSH